MGTGAPGRSWAPAPERVGEVCAPAADSATTHRKEINNLFFLNQCCHDLTRELKASVKQTSPGFSAETDFCTQMEGKTIGIFYN